MATEYRKIDAAPFGIGLLTNGYRNWSNGTGPDNAMQWAQYTAFATYQVVPFLSLAIGLGQLIDKV